MADLGFQGFPERPDGVDLMDHIRTVLEMAPPAFTTVWISDHLQFGADPVDEGWTKLAYLAAAFPRFTYGHLVLSQSYRNPALLAKMAATLQRADRRPVHPRPGRGLARRGVPRVRLRLSDAGRPRGAAGGDHRAGPRDVDAVAGDLPRDLLPRRGCLLRASPRPADPDHGRHERAEGARGHGPPRGLVELGRPVDRDVPAAVRDAQGPLRGDRPAVRRDPPDRRDRSVDARGPGDIRADLCAHVLPGRPVPHLRPNAR